ncbi:MAG: LPXTG cell wall anchor domain-containing protein [Polyangiaceae bacterium]
MPDVSTLSSSGQVFPVLLLCGAVVAVASVACVIALMIKAAANLALRLGMLVIFASTVLAVTTLLGSGANKTKTRSLSSTHTSSSSDSLWLAAAGVGTLVGVASVVSARRRRR